MPLGALRHALPDRAEERQVEAVASGRRRDQAGVLRREAEANQRSKSHSAMALPFIRR
jgi:hypothetical protein